MPWVARNERYGLKVTVDNGSFVQLPDGTTAISDVAPSRRRLDQPVMEFVTERPLAELDGDPATNTTAALDVLRQTASELDHKTRLPQSSPSGSSYELADILRAEQGWTLHPEAADVRFIAVKTAGIPTLATQHTKGVPLGAVSGFMEAIGERIYHEDRRRVHDAGGLFAQTVIELFAPHAAPNQLRIASRDLRDLHGAMWLTFVHVAGLALATTKPLNIVGGKGFSAVALRQSLRSLREELSPRVQGFLDDNAEAIRTDFEDQFLRLFDTLTFQSAANPLAFLFNRPTKKSFSAAYVDARKVAISRHEEKPQFHLEPAPLGDDPVVRPLDALRYAPLTDPSTRPVLRVGDYLDTMLLREPAVTVNQDEAFGMAGYFDVLDHARGDTKPGLLLLELRYDSQPLITPEQIHTQYDELTAIVRDAVNAVEPVPIETPEQLTAAIEKIAGAGRPYPGDGPRAGTTARAVSTEHEARQPGSSSRLEYRPTNTRDEAHTQMNPGTTGWAQEVSGSNRASAPILQAPLHAQSQGVLDPSEGGDPGRREPLEGTEPESPASESDSDFGSEINGPVIFLEPPTRSPSPAPPLEAGNAADLGQEPTHSAESPGAGDGGPRDVAACTVLLGEAMDALYPDRLATVPATGVTRDDSVLDGRALSRLLGGAKPVRTSWPEVNNALHEAAGPDHDRRSSALILVPSAGNRMGHALGAHRFRDGQVRYFDLHAATGHRVTEQPPTYAHSTPVSMVVLDDTGREVPQPPRPESASTAEAILDPRRHPSGRAPTPNDGIGARGGAQSHDRPGESRAPVAGSSIARTTPGEAAASIDNVGSPSGVYRPVGGPGAVPAVAGGSVGSQPRWSGQPPASDRSRAGVDTGTAAAPKPPTHPGGDDTAVEGTETRPAPYDPAGSNGLHVAESTTTTDTTLVHASAVLAGPPPGSARAALRAVGTGVDARTDTQTSTQVGQDVGRRRCAHRFRSGLTVRQR
jgi:hypothetical protein